MQGQFSTTESDLQPQIISQLNTVKAEEKQEVKGDWENREEVMEAAVVSMR